MRQYDVQFTISALQDQINFKKYILRNFRYKEYGESFDKKMKSAVKIIKNTNSALCPCEFTYRGYKIYVLEHKTYLFLYIVDEYSKTIQILRVFQNGMDWKRIIQRWIQQN